MSYVFTHKNRDGGFTMEACLWMEDGRILRSVSLTSRGHCDWARDPNEAIRSAHHLGITLITRTQRWVAEHAAYLSDPSSLDRTAYTKSMKDFIRSAPWMNEAVPA